MDASFIFRGVCALTSSPAAVCSEIRVVSQGELAWEVFSPGVRVAGSRTRPPWPPASVSSRGALGFSCARHHAECCWGLVSYFLSGLVWLVFSPLPLPDQEAQGQVVRALGARI